MTSRSNGLLEMLGVRLPIIQAPMAGVQGSALAIAVSNAGGLGSLPCAMLSLDSLRTELQTIASHTTLPYNVNFFCHKPAPHDAGREAAWRAALAPYYTEFELNPNNIPPGTARTPFSHDAADVLEEFRPPVVSFHFGLPEPDLLARVKAWGAIVLSSATTVDEARWLEAHGADAVIAQGLEAGGHRGVFLLGSAPDPSLERSIDWNKELLTQQGTFALLPQLVSAISCPVIAAGGIADAAGVKAVLTLGAAAAQIGTAYLLCPEATTSAVHRAALMRAASGAAAQHTALTSLFTGRPARGIVNRVMRELGPLSAWAPAFPTATAAMAPLRSAAEKRGSSDFSPLWSGQNTSGCKAVAAAQLTIELAT